MGKMRETQGHGQSCSGAPCEAGPPLPRMLSHIRRRPRCANSASAAMEDLHRRSAPPGRARAPSLPPPIPAPTSHPSQGEWLYMIESDYVFMKPLDLPRPLPPGLHGWAYQYGYISPISHKARQRHGGRRARSAGPRRGSTIRGRLTRGPPATAGGGKAEAHARAAARPPPRAPCAG